MSLLTCNQRSEIVKKNLPLERTNRLEESPQNISVRMRPPKYGARKLSYECGRQTNWRYLVQKQMMLRLYATGQKAALRL